MRISAADAIEKEEAEEGDEEEVRISNIKVRIPKLRRREGNACDAFGSALGGRRKVNEPLKAAGEKETHPDFGPLQAHY